MASVEQSTDWSTSSTVVAIHVAPATRLPMKALRSVEAEAERGLVGDRYHGSRRRQVTVQSLSELHEAAERLGQPIDPATTRRNITVDRGVLPDRTGARLRIADVELEVVRPAAPCRIMEDTVGPGAHHALRDLAGVVCRVRSSGLISVGSSVDLAPGERTAD